MITLDYTTVEFDDSPIKSCLRCFSCSDLICGGGAGGEGCGEGCGEEEGWGFGAGLNTGRIPSFSFRTSCTAACEGVSSGGKRGHVTLSVTMQTHAVYISLVPRPSTLSVFDHLQYSQTEGEGLGNLLT